MTEKAYRFPAMEELALFLPRFERATSSQIWSFASRLCGNGADSHLYSRIRSAYCAMNLVLNARGETAPIFRPRREVKSKKGLSPDEQLLSCDRQVLDLHYLHCQYHERVRPSDAEFRPLFANDEFDFELASEFAARKWTPDVKARNSLRLPKSVQQELVALRERSQGDRLRTVMRASEQIEVRLHDLSDSPRSRLLETDIPARVEEFICLKLGKGSPKNAMRFAQLRGQDVPVTINDARNGHERFRKRKEWFESALGVSGW